MAKNNQQTKKQKSKKRSPMMLVLQLIMAGLAVLLVVSFISGRVQLARMQRESDKLAGQI